MPYQTKSRIKNTHIKKSKKKKVFEYDLNLLFNSPYNSIFSRKLSFYLFLLNCKL